MAGLLNLIEKHMVLWELKRRLEDLGQRPGRCISEGVAYGPCLLVSRERGSGGSRLARLAGEKLGWQVFDREILDQIAQLATVRLQLTQSLDEVTRSKLQNLQEEQLKPENLGDSAYLRYLREVVMTLGHHGDVVLVGRGAQYLLPSACALRVRVVASLELRVKRLAEASKLGLEAAKQKIEHFDAQRSGFVRDSFHCDASSPLNYDLVINTSEISPESAVDVVLAALKRKLGVAMPK